MQDPRVNRLEDSLLLWKSVVSNKLLSNVNVVLFLNKVDLLQVSSAFVFYRWFLSFLEAKLDSGVKLSHHMISYGDRPNDFDSVSKCEDGLS